MKETERSFVECEKVREHAVPKDHEDRRQQIIAWIGTHVLPQEAAVRRWLRERKIYEWEVDDIIQEAYARLIRLPDINHILRPGAYFQETARRLLIDRIRRARIVPIDSAIDLNTVDVGLDEPSPERAALGRRELERVRQLLEHLPERTRRIIEMRKIDEMPQRKIAETLGITESVVENDLIRGQRMLLRLIAENEAYAERKLQTESEHERARDRTGD